MKSSVLISNVCEAVVESAVVECVKIADTLVLKIWSLPLCWSVRGLTAMWQAWYSSFWSPALCSVRRISISSAGAHRLQTEFPCLLSWLLLQGLSAQYSWSHCWITEGRQRGSCSKEALVTEPQSKEKYPDGCEWPWVRVLFHFFRAACCRWLPWCPLYSPPPPPPPPVCVTLSTAAVTGNLRSILLGTCRGSSAPDIHRTENLRLVVGGLVPITPVLWRLRQEAKLGYIWSSRPA